MGMLGGFSYRNIKKRLKKLGFTFIVKLLAAMRSGIQKNETSLLRYLITKETCLKEH
jgi:hypothetical protein